MFNLGPDVQSTVDMPLGELSSKERESGDRYEMAFGIHILRYSMLTLPDGYSNSYSNFILISCGRIGVSFDRQLVTRELT